jgi:hypothetical protein
MRLALVLALALPSLVATGVRADDEEDAEEAFQQGLTAFDAGDLEAARASYERSLALHPTAAAAFNLAGVLTDLERPIAAGVLYDELSRGVYGALDDAQLVEVAALGRAAEDAVARIEVRVASATPVEVQIDGETVGTATEDSPVTHTVEPGVHSVRGARTDGLETTRDVDVRPGGLGRALLRFEESAPPDRQVDDPVLATPLAAPDEEPSDDDGRGISPWVWVLVGALVVGGGVTAAILLTTNANGESGDILPATGTLLAF